jgi:hypothetical protein
VDQLYHKDLAYVVERLVALRAASEATGRGAGQRQAARRLAGAGLAPQVHSALDWGEAEAAAQQEQQLLAADQAEAEAMPPPGEGEGGVVLDTGRRGHATHASRMSHESRITLHGVAYKHLHDR